MKSQFTKRFQFIHHRNFQLWVEPAVSQLAKQDATLGFTVRALRTEAAWAKMERL